LQRIGALLILLLAGCTQTGYQQRDGVVSFITWDEGYGRREHPIAGVEVSSFEVLRKQGYAKDRSHVWYRWTRIDGADPASFTALSDIYAKDRQHVFYENKVVPGADPSSVTIFGVQWARDRSDIYLQDEPIEACDPPTFVLLEHDWQRDSRCVYNRRRKLANADPASFAVLNFWYGKDARQVYYNNARPVAGADPNTFVIAKPCEVCARDAQRCYKDGEVTPCNSGR
jgi:hypothetical protein